MNVIRRMFQKKLKRLHGRGRCLRFEPLEDRKLMAPLTVDSLDGGPGANVGGQRTLQWAIQTRRTTERILRGAFFGRYPELSMCTGGLAWAKSIR
jgi:hypothetical protein